MAKVDLAESKSCGPQLFRDGDPTNEWGIDELSSYAQIQYRQIIEGEKSLAPSYWWLGHGLVLAKKPLNHGQWKQFLNNLGIDKTRASKARAIYNTFPELEKVTGLTVEEAYAQRSGKQQNSASDSPKDNIAEQETQRVRKSIDKIAKQTGDAVHDAAFAGPEEAAILIPAVRKAIDELRELLRHLEEQVSTGKQIAGAKCKSKAKK